MPERIGDVLSWASEVDPHAIEQAQKSASLPFVVKPLALMADAQILVNPSGCSYKTQIRRRSPSPIGN